MLPCAFYLLAFSLAKNQLIWIPIHLLIFFKISNHGEPIASELSAVDYLYEVLLEICESKNCDEEIYEVIHDSSLNEKHDCNDYTINSINVNCVNDMKTPKLEDVDLVMSATYSMIMIGVMMILMMLIVYLSLMMNMFAIILNVGSVECQL